MVLGDPFEEAIPPLKGLQPTVWELLPPGDRNQLRKGQGNSSNPNAVPTLAPVLMECMVDTGGLMLYWI